jgi:hypothetical protein
LRVTLGVFAVLSLHLQPVTVVGGDWLNRWIHGGEPWSEFLSSWQRWDALWYQHIAESGYHAGDGSAAFYPLYPLLVRGLSLLLDDQTVWAELVVSSAAFVVAMALLYNVVRLDVGPRAARLTVFLTAFFPTGFVFVAPYTESLYLALTLAAFWWARHGRPWAAGCAACAAALTRTQGIFLVVPLAVEDLQRRRQERTWPNASLLAATLPALGFVLPQLYDRYIVGERAVGLGAQSAWGYTVVAPWQTLAASWAHITARGDLVEALNLVCLLGFTLLALCAAWRLPLSYSLYALPYLALLFTRQMYFSPLLSVARFTIVLFPCFIVAAAWLSRRRQLAGAWLVMSVLLLALLLQYWVHFGVVL